MLFQETGLHALESYYLVQLHGQIQMQLWVLVLVE